MVLIPNSIPPKAAYPPHIVIAAPSFITMHDTTATISHTSTMPDNYHINLSPCSLPPTEHKMMIKRDVNVLTILDRNLHSESMLGHIFYHTFTKDKTTSNVTASITSINEKEETLARHPMIKTLKRMCPSDPELINRLKQILNMMDDPQAINL